MIEITGLTKVYANKTAVKGLTATIEKGKIYGLLGPNGAGKSTTMNMITGCLAATDGKIIINGKDIYEHPLTAKKYIGYLPETPPLYPDMTPFEYLVFVARAKGISKKDINSSVSNVMQKTGIADVKDKLIKYLSKGYKQRVGIAQAILGEPDYIILDEPTVGLDPTQMIEIRELIKSLGVNRTVILSSHILSEVSNICDEVLVIANGQLVAMDTPQNLTKHFTANNILNILVRTDNPEYIKQILESVEGVIQINIFDVEDNTARFELDTGILDIRDKIFFTLADLRTPIIELNIYRPTLEDVFIELTSKEVQEEKYILENETDTANNIENIGSEVEE